MTMNDARPLSPEDQAELDRELDAANRQVWDPSVDNFRDWGMRGAEALKAKLEAVLIPMVEGATTASEMAHIYIAVRRISDALKAATDVIAEQYRRLGQEIIPDAFANEKITSFTTSDGYRVTTQIALRTSIIADQKEAAHQWLRDNGLGALITQTVNANTLSAAGKTFLEEGRELPEELFHAYFQNSTSVTQIK